MSQLAKITQGEIVDAEQLAPPMSMAVTPMAMLSQAVARGASIEILTKLMDLSERWEANQARKAFDTAVARAKAEIPVIGRNREGHNSKRYADFSAYAAVIDPIISKYGLSYRFRTEQVERITVTCILSHEMGHSEPTTLSGPADKTGSKNDIQAIGSTLTYLQRYTLVQALGLAAGDDDDGKASGKSDAITDEQAEQITTLALAVKADVPKLLAFFKAESITDMRAKDFAKAVAMLEAKRQKGAA